MKKKKKEGCLEQGNVIHSLKEVRDIVVQHYHQKKKKNVCVVLTRRRFGNRPLQNSTAAPNTSASGDAATVLCLHRRGLDADDSKPYNSLPEAG